MTWSQRPRFGMMKPDWNKSIGLGYSTWDMWPIDSNINVWVGLQKPKLLHKMWQRRSMPLLHKIFMSTMGLGGCNLCSSTILEHVDCVMWVPWTKQEYLFTIHISGRQLEIWVKLYSRHFSLESLFIPVLFVINAIHNNNVTENIYTIHNFQTFCNYIVHYHCRFISIFVSFSPWRWDNGGPCHMLNIESNTTIN